jgi:hypothetical protein
MPTRQAREAESGAQTRLHHRTGTWRGGVPQLEGGGEGGGARDFARLPAAHSLQDRYSIFALVITCRCVGV